MSEPLSIIQEGRLLRIAFAREGCGVSDSMAERLSETLALAHETSDAVLLTSVGPDFCTGRARDAAGPPSPEAYTRRDEYSEIFGSYTAIRETTIPVVASIEGILWIAYSAEYIDAQRALTYGIVSTVVPAASLLEEAERFCRVLLSRPRPAILGLKEYLRVAPRMDERGATDYARSQHSMVNTAAAMKRPAH